jgi:hypothetical protein
MSINDPPELKVTTPNDASPLEDSKITVPPADSSSQTSPVSPADGSTSKFESAREARRQARRKLLDQMEEEGKLKREDPTTPVTTREAELKTEILPKKRTRRRKVGKLGTKSTHSDAVI